MGYLLRDDFGKKREERQKTFLILSFMEEGQNILMVSYMDLTEFES